MRKERLLVVAYMGTGKTVLARDYSNVIDLDFQDYMYIYDKSIRNLPLEKRKGKTELRTENSEYPNNFITKIIVELEKDKIVAVPFIDHVLDAINSDKFKQVVNQTRIILVFPYFNNFEEYVERFKRRGNNEEFILRRRKEFPDLIRLFENLNYEKILIKPNQFLSQALIEYGIDLEKKNKKDNS